MISSEVMTGGMLCYFALIGTIQIIAGLKGLPTTQKYTLAHAIFGFIMVIIVIVLFMW